MRLRRLIPALLLSLALALPAAAELSWPDGLTAAQEKLKTYMEQVNETLVQQGASPFNRLFELYSGFASLAVTSADDAEIPENVELTVTMDESTLCVLTLRVSDTGTFVSLAGACIQAACP